MPQRDQIQSAGDYDLGQVAILGSSGHIVNITTHFNPLNILNTSCLNNLFISFSLLPGKKAINL